MKRRARLETWIIYATLIVALVVIDFPVFIVLVNGLKSDAEFMTSFSLLPSEPTLVNFVELLEDGTFFRFMINGVIIATLGTLAAMIPAILAGYAISRYRSRAVSAYSRSILIVQMLPIVLMLVPMFLVIKGMGLLNTYWAVVILYAATLLPFATWVARSFFDKIPRDLEEAAWIDGCSRIQALVRVIVPLGAPAVASIGIFSFIAAWNEYLLASLFLRAEEAMTVPVGVQRFLEQYSTDWGSLMAASTLAMLPSIVVFVLFQRYFVAGALTGGVKG
jgi:ABC-type glycerol-3-phosphate transport system permease component